jgi:predicted DNA-binding ribbon-helix-helix protein
VAAIRKHSVKLNGHATSVSLEDEYWSELRRMAAQRDLPLAELIGAIDAARKGENLSSALRLAVLADLKGRAGERVT